ncbi:MarC family protein [Aliifodinibius sp. S!AR15-10]|uniref:MarC family protein n=1 Tax=Aliifodinibius sp. S!AR15-10 TaxID=2950437 RepID=UPI00285E9BB9|nr:MarC family protein [Aliifodinibius sp. S!AR15-10]MDR8391688.1 MarC family protein [Aliifodinibius sp. S!AR15-10]
MDIAVFLNALTGFFVIIDPIGAALVFHSLVPEGEIQHRRKMAFKTIVISIFLLVVFGNYGEPLLNQLGININSLRIAGGLLLFYTAFNMITEKVEYSSATQKKDISVFPMTIPMLAGPGALTLSILMFSQSGEMSADIAVTVGILTVLSLTLILMLLAKYLKKVIGRTGDEILRRFLGVILAALAIQFVYDGIVNIAG